MIQFIRDIHAAKRAAGQPVISFEFFPPRTEALEQQLPLIKLLCIAHRAIPRNSALWCVPWSWHATLPVCA